MELVREIGDVKVYAGWGDHPWKVYCDGELSLAFRFEDEAMGYAEELARQIATNEQRKWDTCANCGGELINGYCPSCGAKWHNSKRNMIASPYVSFYGFDVYTDPEVGEIRYYDLGNGFEVQLIDALDRDDVYWCIMDNSFPPEVVVDGYAEDYDAAWLEALKNMPDWFLRQTAGKK